VHLAVSCRHLATWCGSPSFEVPSPLGRSCNCSWGFGLGLKSRPRMGQVFSVIGAGSLSCQPYANCQNSRGAPSGMVRRTDWRCRILNQRRRVLVIITGHFCSSPKPPAGAVRWGQMNGQSGSTVVTRWLFIGPSSRVPDAPPTTTVAICRFSGSH